MVRDMSTRTLLPKPRKQASRLRPVSLREDYTPGSRSPLKVDRDARVIYGIKILGWDSRNGRKYLPEGVKASLHKYDGAKAFCDHPAKATDPRICEDALGVWRNPRADDTGVFADLHYFQSHPLLERVIEDAERGLGVFGASHNADGDVEDAPDGLQLVRSIREVRSVDLVTDAATVTNLRESHMPQTTTLRALIEANAKAKAFFKTLLEMPEDEMAPLDMPMEPPAEPAAEDPKALLVKAIGAYVATGAPEDYETAKKLLNLVKPASAETETVAEEDDEEKKEEDKPATEGRQAKSAPGAVTLTEAKSLIKLAGLTEDAALLTMLDGTTRDKAMALLEWAKAKATPQRSGVRSQGPGNPAPERNGKAAKDADDLAALLKR